MFFVISYNTKNGKLYTKIERDEIEASKAIQRIVRNGGWLRKETKVDTIEQARELEYKQHYQIKNEAA